MMRLAERVDLSLENHVPVVIQMFIDGFEPTESTRSVWAVVVRVPSFPAAVSMRACELSTCLLIYAGNVVQTGKSSVEIVSFCLSVLVTTVHFEFVARFRSFQAPQLCVNDASYSVPLIFSAARRIHGQSELL